MCLAVYAQPALGITIYLLTGLPVLWSDSTAKYAVIETDSAWGWTHSIVLRNFKKQTSFSEMWSALHLAKLKNSIKLHFLGRTGLWQWKTNQALETGLKIALKHANRPDLVSESPICLLLPSFLPLLYHILHSASSSSLRLIRMSEFLQFFWHHKGLIWHGTHRYLHWTPPRAPAPAATAAPGHFPHSAACCTAIICHRVVTFSVISCHKATDVITCWPGEWGQPSTQLLSVKFMTCSLAPMSCLLHIFMF